MAGSFDGETISDMLRLAEFASWLRRSSRDMVCVLVSQKADGRPVVPFNRIRKQTGARAVVTMMSNTMQRSARNQLGSVNPFHGAARIFPVGDSWTTDPRLVRFVRGDLSPTEFLNAMGEQLQIALAYHGSPTAEAYGRVTSEPWKASKRSNTQPTKPAAEKPSLADVRDRNRLYRIDMAHAKPCADFIRNQAREIPCILVSLPCDSNKPYLDIDALLDEIGDNAVVLQITDRKTDDWLNDRLPSWARAYDGACRFLPPHASNTGARLCRMNTAEDNTKTIDTLSELVLNTAYSNGYTTGGTDDTNTQKETNHPSKPAHTEKATIEIIFNDIAYVRTNDGTLRKTNLSESTAQAGVTANHLIRKGQTIQGHPLDENDFEFTPQWQHPDDALKNYLPGSTITGMASAVYSDLLILTLYPALGNEPATEARIHGPEILSNTNIDPNTDLRPIIHKNEPIALHVEEHSDHNWRFSLPDNTEHIIQPASLLKDGPEWIDPTNALAYLDRLKSSRSLADMPLDELLDTVDTLDAAKDTIRKLHTQLRSADRLNRELDSANETLRRSNDSLRKNHRDHERTQDDTSPIAPFTGLFPSIRDELDWQLHAQSLLQFNVTERIARPLDDWSYKPEFFKTLTECEHGDMFRTPLLRTMLFVLTGHDDLNGARTHRLREGGGGDDADRVDENGNYIYRVDIHGQYRLHYVRDTAHHVIFRSVGPHDAELR